MDKDIEVWKQRNEILHKKVERQMEDIRKLQKDNQDLTNEMILVKGITVTNSPELREANKKIEELQGSLERARKENNDLYNRLADSLEVNESHQRLNGKLQVRVTELEDDNKKISKQVEDQVERARKAGL
jgi:predicted RNase H-like nuclease (RuvC/YqgF family)